MTPHMRADRTGPSGSARRRRRRAVLGLTALLVATAAAPTRAQVIADGTVYSEDEVKAAFVYHFGTYVVWPDDTGDEVTIAVIDADAILTHLERFLPGRTIADRPVVARSIDAIDDLDDADVLFIGESDGAALAEIIRTVGERPVLIVTDAPDALRFGSMVNLRIVEERVRFEISLGNAQRAGLMLSSRLLAAAIHVERD